ncbi:hypothetical protein HN358_00085 [Candidatus Uhrbacteria bacterium]|jgi:uncharacterized membrane protein YphA (DoxX/SURF4 family)|nr:hypothetical protein [Candidatus Uhrbacteria bacterium]MBT7717247.1 hypothetical protein [Candidatus Uhrbacteria bacterium]
MRRRTLFGIFSQATNQIWFSTTVFVLRVLVGFNILLFGVSRVSDWSLMTEVSQGALFKTWFLDVVAGSWFESAFPWLMIVLGLMVIIGAMVRPTSLVLIVLLLVVYAWSFDSGEVISPLLIIIATFGLFMSGGVGHIIGMDHLLYHYAREKTCITKLLLG